MPEHAAYVTNMREVGADGKTAYDRSKGKRVKCLGVEFGEKVFFKKKAKGTWRSWKPGGITGFSLELGTGATKSGWRLKTKC